MMKRYDIINAYIRKNKYVKYLEIGVRDNRCFNKIKIKDKSGVDPMQDEWEIEKGKATGWDSSKVPVKYRMTSDEYFEKYNIKYDIIFIDGLHENEQVYRDIQNSLNCLNKGGTILMHDCFPEKEIHQQVPRVSDHWNGDVWKAYVRVRNERKDVEMCVVDTDTGVGVIKLLDEENYISEPAIKGKLTLDWNNYIENQKDWMNIVSTDYITLDIGEEYFENKRAQSFLHSGNLGDVIYALPFIIHKGGGDLYIRNKNDYSVVDAQHFLLYRLLIIQPYIGKVRLYDDKFGHKTIIKTGEHIGRFEGYPDMPTNVKYNEKVELDYDLDYFRTSKYLRDEHLITSYFRAFSEQIDNLPLPFLKLDENFDFKNDKMNERVSVPKENFNLFNITHRYRDDYNWGVLIKEQSIKCYYTGLKSEYVSLCKDYDLNEKDIQYIETQDLFDVAILIKKTDKFFCNPSVATALAVSMNVDYYIRIPISQKEVITNLPIENLLD